MLLREFLRVYLFIIPLIVLVLCEVVKALVESRKSGLWHAKLFHPGGMPSSHSAFVTSLLIIVGRKLGVHSVEFAMTFVLASIVWYDAFSTRRVLGEQSEILNRLQHWKHLKEHLGHSFRQVIAGIAFGAVVTMLGIWVQH